jgi:syntaxin-binding protein 1
MISSKTFDQSLVQIAGKINRCIREYGLRDIGQLEQDLVFGDAGAKEVISILRSKQVCTEREIKNRLAAKLLSF